MYRQMSGQSEFDVFLPIIKQHKRGKTGPQKQPRKNILKIFKKTLKISG